MDSVFLINNIKNLLNCMYNGLQNEIFIKAVYYRYLKELDQNIISLVENTKYDRNSNNDSMLLFKTSTDERLHEAEEKLNSIDMYDIIPYTIKWIGEALNKWWDDLGFNYIESFSINSYGSIECVLGIMLKEFGSSFSNTPETDKIKYQEKIDNIVKKGYQLSRVQTFGLVLRATEKNKRLLIKEFKAKFPKFHIYNIETISEKCGKNDIFFINKIKISINPEVFKNFENIEEEQTPVKVASETLTNDDVAVLLKELKDFNFSQNWGLEYIQKGLNASNENVRIAMNLCESHFSRCCEIFDYDSKTLKLYKKSHESEKSKNIRIREIERQIMEKKNVDTLKKNIDTTIEDINRKLMQELRMSISEFSLNQYCVTKLKLHFSLDKYDLMLKRKKGYSIMSVQELKNMGLSLLGNKADERNKVIDNDVSRKIIIQNLYKIFPSAEIDSIVNEYRDGVACIYSVNITVRNFSNFKF